MKLTGKILIVDDDESTLEFFDIMLTNLGFEIVKAVDGIEALEQVKVHRPDLMLLDNVMPRMNGFEVTQIIKKDEDYVDYRDTPIIMFSALNNPEDKILGLEMGIDDYITKPFNFSEVLARIRNVIRHKELSNQLLKRERRLAILESLNTNLIAFTRHVKKPLTELREEIDVLNFSDESNVEAFKKKYEYDYREVSAMLDGLEEEIMEIQRKGNQIKEQELSLEELEKRIDRHLKASDPGVS